MLPATLLSSVEAHKCFTGCYRYESPIALCVDPAQPLVTAVQVSCAECLSYSTGALASLLPAAMTGHTLAVELSAHVRTVRGFKWAFSGYHTAGGGFWLSAVSLTDEVFLVDGSRNYSKKGTDAELLVEAFKHRLAPHKDARMLDPAHFSADVVHVDLSVPLLGVRDKSDVLTAPQCSPVPRPGTRRVAVLELLPAVSGAIAATAVGAGAATGACVAGGGGAAVNAGSSATRRRALAPGETCPVCHAEYKERPLFTGSYVGCLC